jgi:hypothetical protein
MRIGNNWTKIGLVLAVGVICGVSTEGAGAQVQTTTQVQSGESMEVVQVDRGEVLAVEGNDLIVKMENGSVRHFENIPESAKATVNGKQLGVHELKPGMKLERTITTTTTPQVVTTIETVKGKVWYIAAPTTVLLTLENGTNQSFKIPKDQKFNVDGQMVDAFGLKKGMLVTATKIVEVPVSVVAQGRSVSGTMPAPPVVSQTQVASAPVTLQAPAVNAPLLIAEGAPTAAPSEATDMPAPPAPTNPLTRGYLPLISLGLLLIIIFAIARSVRAKSRT